MNKKQDYVVKIEKAISKKYGSETIQNPKGNWDDEKEKQYLEQLKEVQEKESRRHEASERVEKEGFFISKKLVNRRKTNRSCPVCDVFSFDKRDDVYMKKFECCFSCYIKWVEDREERWQSGWRPTN